MLALPDILNNITFDEWEDDIEVKVENKVAEKMPGYTIYTWDADAQGVIQFAEELTSIINRHIKKGAIEDIQFSDWMTDDNEIVLAVVAIKTK